MSDGRKNNGGNSTKAVRPDDKRLNNAKKLLDKYLTNDFNYSKLKGLLDTLYKAGLENDTRSSTLFLSYVLGKPKEYIDLTSGDEPINDTLDYSKLKTQTLLDIARVKSESEQS